MEAKEAVESANATAEAARVMARAAKAAFEAAMEMVEAAEEAASKLDQLTIHLTEVASSESTKQVTNSIAERAAGVAIEAEIKTTEAEVAVAKEREPVCAGVVKLAPAVKSAYQKPQTATLKRRLYKQRRQRLAAEAAQGNIKAETKL